MSPVNRITGFSGFDTESLVQKIMTAERVPLDKLNFKKQQMTWKQDMYRDINKLFKSLFDSADKLRLNANWSQFKTTSSDEASVSASGVTAAGSHTVNVTQLAESANLVGDPISTKVIAPNNAVALGADGTKSIVVEHGGVVKRIDIAAVSADLSADTAAKVQAALDSPSAFGPGVVNLTLNGGKYELRSATNQQVTIRGYNGDKTLVESLGFTDGQTSKVDTSMTLTDFGNRVGQDFSAGVSFTINGVPISFTGAETVQNLIDKVNTSAAGVKLNFDSNSQKFTFVNNSTGQASKVELDATGNPFLTAIGFSTSNRSAYGKDAKATIDGALIVNSTNSIIKDGITYSLKKVTTSPATINSERDVDALVKQITDFVTEYNKTVESISSKLREKVNRKIQPMSDEDRKNIKEADLKLWEDAAKQGLLRSDDILSKTLIDMRMTVYGGVKGVRADGKDAYLSTIGITTASFTGGNGGKLTKSVAAMDGMLEINEDKLRKALKEDPETVIKTFTGYPDDSVPRNSPDFQARKGIMHRFKELFETVQKDISLRIDNRGQVGGENDSSIEKQIRDMNRRMEDMEDRLSKREDQYYRRFAQMEKVMSQANSQGQWLAGQLGNM